MLVRCIALAAFLAGAAGSAATPAGLSDARPGVFKVVKPPQRGARRLLTIHTVRRGLPPGTSSARAPARHGWFWAHAATELAAADPARLDLAARTAAATLLSAPERALVRRIRDQFGGQIAAAAGAAGISEALLIAVVAAESGGDPLATSSKGAQGLAQLMPATAERFGVANAYDAAENLRAAAEYLSLLLELFGQDALLALAGYNAGENAVLRRGGVPDFAETRDYVPITLSYFHAARDLCVRKVAKARDVCEMS